MPKIRLPGEPGSAEFMAAYSAAKAGEEPCIEPINVTGLIANATAKRWISAAHKRVRDGALKRGIPWNLTRDEFQVLLERSDGRCEVTNIPFELACLRGEISGRNPWGPSIDRIDSSKGYAFDNCRFVCRIVNYAMNEWGEAILWELLSKSRSLLPYERIRLKRRFPDGSAWPIPNAISGE